MLRIALIVEGHGEVSAVPILVRRIARVIAPNRPLEISRPIRVKRQRLLKIGELERAVEFGARQTGPDGRILILLDADLDCPKDLAPQILRRATIARSDRAIRVVLAKFEYEAWFLAAADSIAGVRDLDPAIAAPSDSEAIRDAKGWLSSRMPRGRSYRETIDQAALTSVFDLDSARNAPSFDKMWRDVSSIL